MADWTQIKTNITVDSETHTTENITLNDLGKFAIKPHNIMPSKGQIINMTLGNTAAQGTNNKYRVLSINNTIAEVVALYDYVSCCYNTYVIGGYSGTVLDNTLNTTFYESLSSEAKFAIVQKNITCYKYTFNSSVYNNSTHASYADYSTKETGEIVESRYVYALDIEDIENYFNNTFSSSDILTFFDTATTYTYPWLRSYEGANKAWYSNASYGLLTGYIDSSNNTARPAFRIDLSKIEWS